MKRILSSSKWRSKNSSTQNLTALFFQLREKKSDAKWEWKKERKKRTIEIKYTGTRKDKKCVQKVKNFSEHRKV